MLPAMQSHAHGVGETDDLLPANKAQHAARLKCPPPPLRLEPLPLFKALFGDSMPLFDDILGSQDDFERFPGWDEMLKGAAFPVARITVRLATKFLSLQESMRYFSWLTERSRNRIRESIAPFLTFFLWFDHVRNRQQRWSHCPIQYKSQTKTKTILLGREQICNQQELFKVFSDMQLLSCIHLSNYLCLFYIYELFKRNTVIK